MVFIRELAFLESQEELCFLAALVEWFISRILWPVLQEEKI